MNNLEFNEAEKKEIELGELVERLEANEDFQKLKEHFNVNRPLFFTKLMASDNLRDTAIKELVMLSAFQRELDNIATRKYNILNKVKANFNADEPFKDNVDGGF